MKGKDYDSSGQKSVHVGVFSAKRRFLGRSYTNRTLFLLMEYEINEDRSHLCTRHGGFDIQRSELVERVNVIRLNIFHGKSDSVAKGCGVSSTGKRS